MAGHTVIVSVLADTKKFSRAFKNLSNEIGLTQLGNGFKKTGTKIVGMAKTGVKAIAGVGAAVTALSLKGGLSRALDTEAAIGLMEQLGMSTKEIEKALEAVDRTFDGTPFANPDGFNFTAQLKTSGRALDDIEKDLRNVSNVTAMTLDKDFGRISDVFLKMSANGKVTAADLNSIGLAGYPIRQVLADGLDVSGDALKKMVSAGELTYDELQNVLSGVKDLDGAAQNLGDNTRVSWGNMLTAFSMVGEKFVTGLLPLFKDGFQAIRGWVRDLRAPAEELGKTFAKWIQDKAIPAVKRFAGWLRDDLWPAIHKVWELVSGAFSAAMSKISDAFGGAGVSAGDAGKAIGNGIVKALEILGPILAKAIGLIGDLTAWLIKNKDIVKTVGVAIIGAVAAFQTMSKVLTIVRAAMIAFNVVMAANPIGLIITAIAALVAGLIYFFTQTELGKEIWENVWGAITTAVDVFVTWWQDTVWPIIETVWEAIMSAAEVAAEWYQENVAPVFEAIGELIGAIFEWISDKVQAFWSIYSKYLEFMIDLWSKVWDGIQKVWEKIGPPLIEYIEMAINNLKNIWDTVWNSIKTILTGVWNAIKNVVETALAVVKGIIKTVTSIIKGDWSGAWDAMKETVGAIWEGIKTGVQNGIDTVKDFISGLKDFILNFFTNAGTWLLNAGKAILEGLFDGLKAGWDAVAGWLGDVGGWIANLKGPEEYDKKLLIPAGKWIMGGLEKGLKSQMPALKSTLSNITDTVASTEFEPLEATVGATQNRLKAQTTTAAITIEERIENAFTELLPQLIEATREGTAKGSLQGTSAGLDGARRGLEIAARMG